MKLTTLIIDDEPAAREGLAADIRDIPCVEVSGIASNAFEAFELIHQLSPDVLFLDIDMPGMSGIEFIKLLKVRPLVILTTAYREYALESYDLAVLDYLLKPISPERLRTAVKKAFDWLTERRPSTGSAEFEQQYMFVKLNGKMERLLLGDILYFEAANNYVSIHTKTGRFLTYVTLKRIEEQVPADQFIKVHKSFVVSKNYIRSIGRNSITVNDIEIPISRTFRTGFRKDIFEGKTLKRP